MSKNTGGTRKQRITLPKARQRRAQRQSDATALTIEQQRADLLARMKAKTQGDQQ